MHNTLTSLMYRIGGDLPAIVVELLLIGLCVNWCASVLYSTRGTRPLRGFLVLLIVATLIVRVMAERFGWARLELLYSYVLFGLAAIALVVFQPELRRAVIRAGDVRFHRAVGPEAQLVTSLVKAAGYLSRNRYGALVAIQRNVDLRGWAENGTMINAEVSANLLTTLFYPGSSLHDLGVIIRGTRVVAANCQFPSPDSDEIDAALGSRHLAAIGMSYETDALVLVVSEETGIISLADNGKLTRYLTLDDLTEELRSRLGGGEQRTRRHAIGDVLRRARRALIVVPLTLIIWFLADQATFAESNVKLRLVIEHPDATQIVDVREPRPANMGPGTATSTRPPEHLHRDAASFDVVVRGPARQIDRLRSDTPGRTLELTWVLPTTYCPAGTYNVPAQNVKAVIEGLREIATRSLAVDEDSLAPLRFSVDQRVALQLRVQPDAGGIPLAIRRVEPPEVTAIFRQADLEQLLGHALESSDLAQVATERSVRAPIRDLLGNLGPEEARTVDAPLDAAIGNVRLAALKPQRVSLTVAVVGQRRRIENVVVQLLVSPEIRQRFDVKRTDPNEWRIDVEVEGDEAVVDSLGPPDIQAFVHITPEMVAALPPQANEPPRTVKVKTMLDPSRPGVSIVGEPCFVRVELTPRPGATP